MASHRYAPLPSTDSQLLHYTKKYEEEEHSRSKEGRICLLCLQNRRVLRWTLFTFICLILIVAGRFAYFLAFPPPEFDVCSSLLTPNPTQHMVVPSGSGDESGWAKTMRPSELMELIDLGLAPPRRLIHQSWKRRDGLPDHFQKWSNDWRRIHGTNWTYVFWTDQDNMRLVERHYVNFSDIYRGLPQEIYRADMIRNMYMHKFGGIYSDLDLVPLTSLEKHIPEFAEDTTTTTPVAYVGRMGEASFAHSIPNAFMVSTIPGHRFWLMPLAFVQDHRNEEDKVGKPEELTGPVALRACVNTWQRRKNVEPIEVLEDGKIYPLNWNNKSNKRDHCLCRMPSPWFNEQQCNARFPNSWTVTYWAHSWE